MKDKKAIIMSISIVLILLVVLGISYAFFTYENGERSEIVTGQIYMNYEETTNISLTNVWPETKAQALARTDENGVFEFTITGQNTSRYPIYYEIDLLEGGVITGKTEQSTKILPEHVMVYLERDGEVLVDGVSYADWNNKRIYIDTIPNGTNERINYNYKLRIWIDENVTISDTDPNADYTTTEWNDSYVSLKVRVYGDFEEKTMPTLAETIIASLGTNGLVAIADDGDLYTGDESQVIREYRYIGGESDNKCMYPLLDDIYIINTEKTNCPDACYNYDLRKMIDVEELGGLSCDEFVSPYNDIPTDGVTTNYVNFNDELWRIIGVFPTENENGITENLVKIIKATPLSAEQIPTTYTYNGVEMTLKGSADSNLAYWNKSKYFNQTNYNDWTRAAVQYFLNDETEGSNSYYNSINQKYQEMIQETIYYLGNVKEGVSGPNARVRYIQERSSTVASGDVMIDNLYPGNNLIWNGKIGLTYLSDVAYSRLTLGYSDFESWHSGSGWAISPSALRPDYTTAYFMDGYIGYAGVSYDCLALSPVLYLKSDVKITGGAGTEGSPFQLG